MARIVVAVLVSFLALLAGVFGSIYSDDIKGATPFCFFNNWTILGCCGGISPHAVVFWSVALTATGLFVWAQYDSERRRNREAARSEHHRQEAAEQLRQRSEELKEVIATVPPEDFLIAFQDFFGQCLEALEAVRGQGAVAKENAESAIRAVCRSVAALAQKFDRQPAKVLYGVNIMLFRPANALTEEELSEIRKRLRFVTPETDPKGLRGILDLHLELSISTVGPNQELDGNLEPLALPVPIVEKVESTDKWRVLPGAPMAFCQNRPDGYDDSKSLAQWCETDGTFDDGVIEEVRSYFVQRSRIIRSLIALPLTRFDGSDETIGVLNIHSGLPGLLNGTKMENQFVPIIAPLQAILIQLLDTRARIASADHRKSQGNAVLSTV